MLANKGLRALWASGSAVTFRQSPFPATRLDALVVVLLGDADGAVELGLKKCDLGKQVVDGACTQCCRATVADFGCHVWAQHARPSGLSD